MKTRKEVCVFCLEADAALADTGLANMALADTALADRALADTTLTDGFAKFIHHIVELK